MDEYLIEHWALSPSRWPRTTILFVMLESFFTSMLHYAAHPHHCLCRRGSTVIYRIDAKYHLQPHSEPFQANQTAGTQCATSRQLSQVNYSMRTLFTLGSIALLNHIQYSIPSTLEINFVQSLRPSVN